MPALKRAMRWKTGWDMSKCARGGLHQPPSSDGSALFGGQKLVAVTTTEPGRHEWLPPPPASQRTSKHAPQLRPLLNSAVLSAAVFVP
ncbi:Os02g0744150, partial [Oryza sativa Japonica Group]